MLRTTHQKLQWYPTRVCIFGLFCVYDYFLDYRSELAQIWRQDTDTIHDHRHTPKNISTQVRSAIMGRNGRVVLGAYFQNLVFRTDGRPL